MFFKKIKHLASENPKRIVFPESDDPRILDAIDLIIAERIAMPVLIGKFSDIVATGKIKNMKKVTVIDPETFERTQEFTDKLYQMRKHKGITREKASELMKDYVYFATMVLNEGLSDGMVSGATHTTADTLRPPLQIIKTKNHRKIASSFFIMNVHERVFFFADSGFNIDPNAHELAEIAITTAESARFFGFEPKVAMLSFSTKGSATHPTLKKVTDATEIVRKQKPGLVIDGELQVDAAIVPKVAEKKCPDSPLKGHANVLVFPDLNSGNIAYKLVERLAGADAVGPIMQGLNKPINDLSRGCNVNDIVSVAAITVLQANHR